MRYQIVGETLPVVICELEGGEKMINEGGSMSWMSPNMLMETTTNGGISRYRPYHTSYRNPLYSNRRHPSTTSTTWR